jgi:hypothetical protein
MGSRNGHWETGKPGRKIALKPGDFGILASVGGGPLWSIFFLSFEEEPEKAVFANPEYFSWGNFRSFCRIGIR